MGTIQKIEEALESLPNGLDEIYTRCLEQTKPHESDAIRILQLLLFSDMPHVEHILDATSLNLEAPPGYEFDSTRRMNSFDKLSSLMSTFVRKTRWGYLQIAHSSVRDYLLYTGPGSPPKYRFREIPAKAAVVAVCLGYIASFLTSAIRYDLRNREESWLELAEYTWRALSREQEYRHQTETKHIAQEVMLSHDSIPQEGSVQEEACNSILKFLVHNGSNIQDRTSYCFGRLYGGPPLYVASAMGLTRIVGKLLSAGVRADEKEGFAGFDEAVALSNSPYRNLLGHFGVEEHRGIQYGQRPPLGYGNALVAACYHGRVSIVQMLLDSRAEVNSGEGTVYGSPLNAACLQNHGTIVKMLLERDADVNQKGELSEYPLVNACASGNSKIVKLLLDKGADVNVGHPLQEACSQTREHEVITEMLLKHGADVNAKGGFHGTALHAAIENGHNRSIKLLLNAGADYHSEGGRHGTILEAACYSKSGEAFHLLIKAGANPNSPSLGRGRILQLAAFKERDDIVRYVLETGADLVDFVGLPYWKQKYVFDVARASRDKVILEGLKIRKSSEGSIHHQDQSPRKLLTFR